MSVRRRLLGSVTAFAAAVVVTSAAHAQFPPRPVGPQPPFGGPAPFGGGPPVSKDQVQAALERLGARFEPGAPKLPFDPALLEKLFANPDPKREPTPADKARAEELLKNPFIKQLAEEMIRRKQAQPGSRPGVREPAG